jgi:hypothetical protein
VAKLDLQERFEKKWRELDDFDVDIQVYPTISQAIDYVRLLGEGDDGGGREVSVLITGSVRLVGAALSVLEGPGAL